MTVPLFKFSNKKMMMSCMKYIYLAVLSAAITLCSTSPMPDMPSLDNDGELWDIFDDPSIEEDLFINGFLDSISMDMMAQRKITPDQLLPQLANLGVFELLDISFYLRTNPLVKRSLIDLPIFEIHMCGPEQPWTVGFHLFWNHTPRCVFSCGKNTNISSYINFDQETFFGKIEELLNDPLLGEFTKDFSELLEMVDFNETLALFEDFSVEQRRTGIMMHIWRQWDRGELRALLPFYYQERNIITSPEKQFLIEQKFGAPDRSTQEQFEKNHAISDRVGLGDLRIEGDYAVYKTDTTAVRLGLMSTIPSYVTITTGIRGTSFECSRKQPTLDLQALLDLITIGDDVTISDQDIAVAALIGDICRNKNGFLLGALDRFNAMVLDTTLGNHRHFGVGPLFRARTLLSAFLEEFDWAERISFNTRISLELFTPSHETRFFAIRNDLVSTTTPDFTSEEMAEANLKFIEQELINKFYPLALTTNVQPGLIFHTTNRWCFSGDVWDFNIGSDFWLQTRESLNMIKTSKEIRDTIDIQAARAPFAYQVKYFGSIGLKIPHDDHTWFFSINAEGTTWHKGIGSDYTVSLNVEANF